jgi:uncharacterized protein with HEPN domain
MHAYFEVNKDIVWRTAVEHIPPLADALAYVRAPENFLDEDT